MQLSGKSGLSVWISPSLFFFPSFPSLIVFSNNFWSLPPYWQFPFSLVRLESGIQGGQSEFVGKKITLNKSFLACMLNSLLSQMVFPQQTYFFPRERNGFVEATLCVWIKTGLAVRKIICVLKWILLSGFILKYITNIPHKYTIGQLNFISFWWN